jgi:hypothetical protein
VNCSRVSEDLEEIICLSLVKILDREVVQPFGEKWGLHQSSFRGSNLRQ